MSKIWYTLIFDGFKNYNPLFFQFNHSEDGYIFLVTDFMCLYEEILAGELVFKRSQGFNPLLEINAKKLCEEISSNLLDISKHHSLSQKGRKTADSSNTKACLTIEIPNKDLVYTLILRLRGFISQETPNVSIPYKWTFQIKESSRIKFGAYVTLPLLVTSLECLNLYNNYYEQTHLQKLNSDHSSQDLIENKVLVSPRSLNKLLLSKSDQRKVTTSPKKKIRAALNPKSIEDFFLKLRSKINEISKAQPSKNSIEIKDNKYFIDHDEYNNVHKRKIREEENNFPQSPINSLLLDAIQDKRGKISLDECFNNSAVANIYELVWKIFSKHSSIKILGRNSIFLQKITPEQEESRGDDIPQREMPRSFYDDVDVRNDDRTEEENKKREKYLSQQRKEMLKKLLEIEEERKRLKESTKKRQPMQKKFKL